MGPRAKYPEKTFVGTGLETGLGTQQTLDILAAPYQGLATLMIAPYRHDTAIYGQNKHAYANLRQIMGLERVGLEGRTQPLS